MRGGSAAGIGPALARGERVVLTGGQVLDVEAGRLVPGCSGVVVEAGRIAALLLGEDRPPAGGAPSADLGGRTIAPALANTHTHLALPMPTPAVDLAGIRTAKRHGRRQVLASLADCLDRGVGTVRDAWTEDLRVLDRLAAAAAAGELPSPRLLRSVMVAQPGGTFSAPRGAAARLGTRAMGLPFVPYDDPASGVVVFPRGAGSRAVRDAVDRAIDERGAQTIKVYDQRERKLTYEPGATLMTQAQLDALADQARLRGLPCTMHHVSRESFRRGVAAGVTSLAHLPLDGPLAEEDLRAFAASETMLEPTATLAFFFSLRLPEDPGKGRLERLRELRRSRGRAMVEELWLEELRPVVARGLERAEEGKARLLGLMSLEHVYRFFARMASHGADNLTRLVDEAGPGRLACGNDAGAAPGPPAAVGLELELLALLVDEPGRPPRLGAADLLRIATVNGARTLGLEAETGTVAPGKRADLVVLDEDPLEAPAVLGQPVAALLVEGRLAVDRIGL